MAAQRRPAAPSSAAGQRVVGLGCAQVALCVAQGGAGALQVAAEVRPAAGGGVAEGSVLDALQRSTHLVVASAAAVAEASSHATRGSVLEAVVSLDSPWHRGGPLHGDGERGERPSIPTPQASTLPLHDAAFRGRVRHVEGDAGALDAVPGEAVASLLSAL